MPRPPSKCPKCKIALRRLPLPNGSEGDYYCSTCPKRWFSEHTVEWAVNRYFSLAGYDSKLGDQGKHEGDIRVSDLMKAEEWIIEAKGQTPGNNHSTDFQTGLGQILMARSHHGLHIIYAFAMPRSAGELFPYDPFPSLVTEIDNQDRAYLRLHWIWVKQVPPRAAYEVEIECPPGSMCECQKRIGTFSFW
jgi:hypothetical protein